MAKIDTEGTYIAKIIESGVNVTKKSGYPQWVARFKATKKWIDTPDWMKHFNLKEPGWVDWTSFDEEIVGFLVLFNSAEDFNDETKLMNYDQIQYATGWDGTSFESLIGLEGEVLIRVKEEEWDGKTSLKVDWIDSKEASPVVQLKSLDASELKSLSARLKMGGLGKKAAPAKPAKPGKPAPAPADSAGTKAATAAPDAEGPSGTTPKPAPTAKKVPSKKAPEPKEAPAVEETGEPLPTETTQTEAWEYVCNHKGGNTDAAIEEAWIAACSEVGEDKDEEQFTASDWAKVRDLVIKDLSL